jgi:hypothetical protein
MTSWCRSRRWRGGHRGRGARTASLPTRCGHRGFGHLRHQVARDQMSASDGRGDHVDHLCSLQLPRGEIHAELRAETEPGGRLLLCVERLFEDVGEQVRFQAGVLNDGGETVGCQQPAGRVLPPDERLEPEQRPGRQAHLRLERQYSSSFTRAVRSSCGIASRSRAWTRRVSSNAPWVNLSAPSRRGRSPVDHSETGPRSLRTEDPSRRRGPFSRRDPYRPRARPWEGPRPHQSHLGHHPH